MYVTYQDLIQIGILVVTLANLIYQISRAFFIRHILENILYIAMEQFTYFADSFNRERLSYVQLCF